MTDRRRINGPSGGTLPPIFATFLNSTPDLQKRPARTRDSNTPRKMFLRTGVSPSASGSAYLEFESSDQAQFLRKTALSSLSSSGLKLTCTVHGPRPLPRSAPFSPHVILTTHVKHATFATRQRRGYLRDATERDLAAHIETALRGVIIGDRWPKSGVDLIITILEGEEDGWWGDEQQFTTKTGPGGPWGMMSVLSGCITVASAAIVDAGIDCVDLVSGGSVALVRDSQSRDATEALPRLVLDPSPSEHEEILAACVVGYLPSRDEITDIWGRGDFEIASLKDDKSNRSLYEILLDHAVQSAKGTHGVLATALRESVGQKLRGRTMDK